LRIFLIIWSGNLRWAWEKHSRSDTTSVGRKTRLAVVFRNSRQILLQVAYMPTENDVKALLNPDKNNNSV
jgi:hypothetical protein